MSARRHRRRPARRRFHALQLDVAFVAAVVAMLALHVFRPSAAPPAAPGPEPVAPDRGPERPAPSFAMFDGEIGIDPLFEPDSVASHRKGALPAPSVRPPPDLAFSMPLVSAPGPLPVRVAAAPAMPFAPADRSFPPSPPLFSDPPPPVGPVAAPGASLPAQAFVFREPGKAFPVVFVDAPGVPPAEVPALEAAAFAMEASLPATSVVARLPLPR